MKRILIILGLVLVIGLSYAQKGMFDIEFGAPLTETEVMLKAQGFVESSRTEYMITYTNASLPNLSALDLSMNDEKTQVVRWKLRYDLSLDPEAAEDFVAQIVDQLYVLHGKDPIEYDYDCDYIWYFPDNKVVYVTIYPEDTMLLYYTTGNQEDDGW